MVVRAVVVIVEIVIVVIFILVVVIVKLVIGVLFCTSGRGVGDSQDVLVHENATW